MPDNTGERVKIVVVIVLALIFIILAYLQLFHKKTDAQAKSTADLHSEPESAAGRIELEVRTPVQKRQTSSPEPFQPVARDIFTPPRTLKKAAVPKMVPKKPKAPPPPKLRLKGTIVDAERSIAIINDQYLRKGDRIHGYTVVRIGKKEVLLTAGRRRLALGMQPNE